MDPTTDVRFTRMYQAYYPDVPVYCARRVDRTDAEDVTNEVFTVLWRKINAVEFDTAAACSTALRTAPSPTDGAAPLAATLKPTDQEVLRLSAWEELTAPQIAQVVGRSASAAEQRLHRAKERLAKALSPSLEPSIATAPLTAEEGGRS